MESKTVCFIGHRKIEAEEGLRAAVRNLVVRLIEDENVRTFAFGSRSEFNSLCHEVVTELKNEFCGIERVCLTTKSEVCCLESKRERLEQSYSRILNKKIRLQGYEKEIEFKNKFSSGKAAYVERNQALIDMSDICVFYFDKNYLPPEQKRDKRSAVLYQPRSGTALAYKYAEQKKKRIINVFNMRVQSPHCQQTKTKVLPFYFLFKLTKAPKSFILSIVKLTRRTNA